MSGPNSGVSDLIAALRDPASLADLDGPRWTALLSVAKAEALLGTLAAKAEGLDLPPAIAALLAAQRAATGVARTRALWEADRAHTALAPLGITPILLKGTAYIAAGLTAGQGRQIGDLDILIPRDRLDEAEAALLAAGWQWLKPDPYDDAYYRQWMHELPPLIHREREAMIDVHHTILPLTHRATPDAAAMLASSKPLLFKGGVGGGCEPERLARASSPVAPHHPNPSSKEEGLCTLSPVDMIIHSAAHLFADGDLAGGLRNLWDLHCLLSELPAKDENCWQNLAFGAHDHSLKTAVDRALRLSKRLFATELGTYAEYWVRGFLMGRDTHPGRSLNWRTTDAVFHLRLTARDDMGREIRPVTRAAFYLRSHWLRMPPLMLARHLWTKWRRH